MAKLSKDRTHIAQQHATPVQRTSSFTHVNGKSMLPPAFQPQITPAQQRPYLTAQSDVGISSKKKRRGKKRKQSGRGSFSETGTTPSESTGTTQDALPQKRTSPAKPERSLRAPPASMPLLLSQEERSIYNKEPEMFEDYAMSSADESQPIKQEKENIPYPHKRRRKESYSPSTQDVQQDEPHREEPETSNHRMGQGGSESTDRPHVASDLSGSQQLRRSLKKAAPEARTLVPDAILSTANNVTAAELEPMQLRNGRFACPFDSCKAQYADTKGVKRHMLTHTNADHLTCSECGKVLSRKDKLVAHLKTHKTSRSQMSKETKDDNAALAEEHVEENQETQETAEDAVNISTRHSITTQNGDLQDVAPDTPIQTIEEALASAESEPETELENEDEPQEGSSRTSPTPVEEIEEARSPHPGEDETDSSSSSEEGPLPPSKLVVKVNVPKRKTMTEDAIADSVETPRKRARHQTEETVHSSDVETHHVDRPKRQDLTKSFSEQSLAEEDPAEDSDEDEQLDASGSEQDQENITDGEPEYIEMPATKPQAARKALHEVSLRRQSSLDNYVHRPQDIAASAGSSRRKDANENRSSKAGPSKKAKLKQPKLFKGKSKLSRTHKGKDKKPKASGSEHSASDDGDSESDIGKPRKKGRRLSSANASWAVASKTGQTGRFSDEEVQILLSWRDSFCTEHDLSGIEFNDLMTDSLRRGKTGWKHKFLTKGEFMQQFYDQLPQRNRRAMLRFRERHFQNVEKSKWTTDEDKELRDLVKQLGPKWVQIGELMGRTQDAVSQRWRHQLNYGQGIHHGEWTTDELTKLEEEVQAIADAKDTHVDDEDLVIPWQAIALRIGTGRSGQQCSNRWRISTNRRIEGKFVKVPLNDRIPGSVAKPPRTPSKMSKRLSGDTNKGERKTRSKTIPKKNQKQYKSAERVKNSDDDADEEQEIDESREQSDGNADDETKSATEDEEEGSDSGDDAGPDDSDAASDGEDQDEADVSDTEKQHSPAADESDSDNEEAISDTIEVRQPTPPPPSSRTRASQRTKPRQPKPSQSQSQEPTQKTPAVSKNPLGNTKTPSNGLGLSQAFAATQANSSAKRTTGKRSVVPDSVAPQRPSPSMSIRRRPVSSPLDVSSQAKDDEDEETQEETQAKSPLSFKSAREGTDSEGDASDPEYNKYLSDTASESDSNDDEERETQANRDAASQNTFWQGVSSTFRNLIPGSQPQRTLSQEEKENFQKNRRRTLLDNVNRAGSVSQSDEDDDE